MDETTQQALRALPAVEELLNHPEAGASAGRAPAHPGGGGHPRGAGGERGGRSWTGGGRRERQAAAAPAGRRRRPAGRSGARRPRCSPTGRLPVCARCSTSPGWCIHTNLGRAPLSEAAIDQVTQVARSYSNLEYDLDAGDRGSRETHVEACSPGSPGRKRPSWSTTTPPPCSCFSWRWRRAARSWCRAGNWWRSAGRSACPTSCGPSGVRLVEVGTTNRTRIGDYEAAITPDTALLLRVHTSNYRILGFTEEAELSELVELGTAAGRHRGRRSGQRRPARSRCLPRENPPWRLRCAAGVDVVCFSGDKLLGGPQAGILRGPQGGHRPAAQASRWPGLCAWTR